MSIIVTLPKTGTFTAITLFEIFESVLLESLIDTDASSATSFVGAGSIDGVTTSYTTTGVDMTIWEHYGATIPNSGTLETISYTMGANTVDVTGMNIDLAVTFGIVASEGHGVGTTATEDFILGHDFVLYLSNSADDLSAGQTFGDGAAFEMTGDDVIYAYGGADVIYSSAGNDTIIGGGGADGLYGGAGNDVLSGGNGKDALYGAGGQDALYGGQGNDILNGGAGRDLLMGGTNRDVLTGGAGSDKFLFKTGDGVDVITDFDAMDNYEIIVLRGVSAITDFADLSTNHMTQVGSDVVIDDGAGLEITLQDVALGALDSDDFLF